MTWCPQSVLFVSQVADIFGLYKFSMRWLSQKLERILELGRETRQREDRRETEKRSEERREESKKK